MGHGSVPDTWEQGRTYEQYVGRWSRAIAPRFLDWLRVPRGRRWLDVGCGTGVLSAAILERCGPASVDGVEPSEGFLETAVAQLGSRVTFHRAVASSLPIDDASMDAVVAGLVLNFVPDLDDALSEMTRVAVDGGVVAAYVWDYADRMELMRRFWDAATDLDPAAATLDEGARFPDCTPEALTWRFASAGLLDIATTGIEIPTVFADFDDYWTPFLGGQGPAPSYVMSLDETARGRLREHLRESVPARPDGSIALVARAWAVRGDVAR
ncbi:class I SAM-dependent methyltransferase [Agromyces bauzanensis]|uniref:Methyltransferase n=1 Tax=Agromyces bauzanensis TaxID=1308924 RepID=A0A917PB63_9MICO|nr:class I SAM-dependent methyltransferase [Agromyces bauzanensis]GGJ69523.1 methyltransferase [Agromyces bauzanensis]